MVQFVVKFDISNMVKGFTVRTICVKGERRMREKEDDDTDREK